MRRLLAAASLVAFPLAGAHAQALVGQFASTCTTLGASSSMTVATSAAIPPASLIVVSAAVANGNTTGNTVSDNQGGANYGIGAVGNQNNIVLIPFSRYVAGGVPSGTLITWSMQGGTGSRACMNVAAFSGMFATDFTTSNGVNVSAMNSTTQSVTASPPLVQARNLVFTEVAYNADPGTVTPPSGTTALTKSCIGAPAFCMQSFFRVALGTGTVAQQVTSQNAVQWEAGLNTYLANLVFSDGYE